MKTMREIWSSLDANSTFRLLEPFNGTKGKVQIKRKFDNKPNVRIADHSFKEHFHAEFSLG